MDRKRIWDVDRMNHAEKIYFVTGMTGYIGKTIVNKLLAEDLGENVHIIGLVHDKSKAQILFGEENKNRLTYIQGDIIHFDSYMSELKGQKLIPDYIIHCAAPTKSAYMISNPVETTESIVVGTRNVLELAKHYQVKSMVYLSSMEVYGQIECKPDRRITEEELGNIDLFDVRSCYPLGKRMAESLCFSYFKEYGVPVKIARLAQTFGKGVQKNDTRVFAQFAGAVREKKDIVLHTAGDSVGNYCEIEDAVEAIFLLLEKGENGEAYNVANEANTMQIREMAELVADKIAHGEIRVVYDIPESNLHGYAATTGLRLSSQKLRQMGWRPKKDLETMYRDMLYSEE